MKKFLFFLLSVIMCSAAALAQDERIITGTVVSAEDGEPMIGATVTPHPKGSGFATATDIDGMFSVSVKPNCTELVITFVGMKPVSVKPDSKPMVIKMSPAENRLDEVIAVAYGTAKRSE